MSAFLVRAALVVATFVVATRAVVSAVAVVLMVAFIRRLGHLHVVNADRFVIVTSGGGLRFGGVRRRPGRRRASHAQHGQHDNENESLQRQ